MKFKTILVVFIIPLIILIAILILLKDYQPKIVMVKSQNIIKLPAPLYQSSLSVEEAIYLRQSTRDYKNEPLTLEEVSQLLWSAQGENKSGSRTAPSAGALYPIEIYLVVKNVKDLANGVYHYLPNSHSLEIYLNDDIVEKLTVAALDQEMIAEAAINIIISGIFERTAVKYGERAEQYVYQESGHVSQNIYLQCESLGLGTVSVGGFDQKAVDQLLGFAEGQMTLYIMPVGRR